MPALLVRESAESRFRAIFGAGRTPNARAAAGFAFTHHVALSTGDLYCNVNADGDMRSRVPFLWFEDQGEDTVYEKNLWYWRNDTSSVIAGLGAIVHEISHSGPFGLEYRAIHSRNSKVLSIATSAAHVSICFSNGKIDFSRARGEISADPAKEWSKLLDALAGVVPRTP